MEPMDSREQDYFNNEQTQDSFRDLFSNSGVLDGWFTVHDGAYGMNETTMTLTTPV